MKRVIVILVMVMVFAAMYLDTLQRKQTKELLRRLIDAGIKLDTRNKVSSNFIL